MSAGSSFLRRRSAIAGILSVSVAVSMFVVSSRSRSSAQGVDLGNEYINRARSAALTNDFDGQIEIVWATPDGPQRRLVEVRSEAGVLSIGNDANVVVSGASRYAKSDGGWAVLWAQSRNRPVRSASEKWDLAVSGGPLIAGRATREVAATERANGRVREKRYFDAISGILLRREQFDDTGRRVRSISYTSITLPPPVEPGSTPKVPAVRDARLPKAIGKVPAQFEAPVAVGDGFILNGAYRRADGSVQLFYSDGLFSASVFQQEGTLDRDGLEPGGVDREIDGRSVHQYDISMGTVLVWESDGLVFTSVSDAPADELDDLVDSFEDESGFVGRTLDYVLGPFGW